MPELSVHPDRTRVEWRAWARATAVLAVVGVVLLAVGVIAGVPLIGRHGGGPVQSGDIRVWRWSIAHRGPLVGLDQGIAVVGDAAVFGPICLLASAVWFWVRRSPAALAPIVAYLGGEGLVFLIRTVIHRPRPASAVYPSRGALPGAHDTSFSFPSGHSVAVTAVLFALLGLVGLTRRSWWPWLAAVLGSAYVADSRLLLGVHWFSDLATGLVLGVCWGVAVAVTLRALITRSGRAPGGVAAVVTD